MDAVTLGKKAEGKVHEWLDLPESGHDFNRIPDQLSGFYGSKNICDFYMYKYPYMYYIESKASYNDNIPFSMITEYQRTEMFKKSKIFGVRSIVVFLYATYKRAFILDIRDIPTEIVDDYKSIRLYLESVDKESYLNLFIGMTETDAINKSRSFKTKVLTGIINSPEELIQ